MKVLIINGSPRPRGNTKIALDEMVKIFDQEGIESEIVHIGNKDIRGCIACMSCKQNWVIVFLMIVSMKFLKSLKKQMDLWLERRFIMALPMQP